MMIFREEFNRLHVELTSQCSSSEGKMHLWQRHRNSCRVLQSKQVQQ